MRIKYHIKAYWIIPDCITQVVNRNVPSPIKISAKGVDDTSNFDDYDDDDDGPDEHSGQHYSCVCVYTIFVCVCARACVRVILNIIYIKVCGTKVIASKRD